MISYITGKIIHMGKQSITVLTASGVGYSISLQVSRFASKQVGDEISLYTYLKVSETAMELFGFETLEEKSFFELLISVKGVGPKGALNILGLGSIDEIQNAIGRGDVKYLTQVSGLGKRTAERLCVELKNKVTQEIGNEKLEIKSDVLSEVVEGLVAMGYSKDEARDVVKQLDSSDKTTEELLREALKYLSAM